MTEREPKTETPRPPTGRLARCLDGRVDRSILSDVGAVVGLVVVARGLVLLSSAAAWIFIGAAIVAASVVAVLPAKQSSEPPKGQSTK
jgi:hypothetical protein